MKRYFLVNALCCFIFIIQLNLIHFNFTLFFFTKYSEADANICVDRLLTESTEQAAQKVKIGTVVSGTNQSVTPQDLFIFIESWRTYSHEPVHQSFFI